MVEEQDLLKILLDDRLYNLVTMDYKSAPIYANAFSNLVLNHKLKSNGELYKTLYERAEELYKTLKFYIETLEHTDESAGSALIGKIKLGIYNLEKALQKLRTLDEVRKLRRRYYSSLATLIALITIFINALSSWYQVIIPFLSSYRGTITILLISACAAILDSVFENKASKKVLEVLKTC